MRDVEFAFGGLTPDRGVQLRGIGLGEGARIGRAHGRIAAQAHDRRALDRIGHLVTAVRIQRNGVRILAIAVHRSGILEGRELGLIDELVDDEVVACAAGLRLDSIRAVVSRYSKLAPVERAASRIAPATRADALAMMESIAISGLKKTGLKVAGRTYGQTGHRHSRTLSILGNYDK